MADIQLVFHHKAFFAIGANNLLCIVINMKEHLRVPDDRVATITNNFGACDRHYIFNIFFSFAHGANVSVFANYSIRKRKAAWKKIHYKTVGHKHRAVEPQFLADNKPQMLPEVGVLQAHHFRVIY